MQIDNIITTLDLYNLEDTRWQGSLSLTLVVTCIDDMNLIRDHEKSIAPNMHMLKQVTIKSIL